MRQILVDQTSKTVRRYAAQVFGDWRGRLNIIRVVLFTNEPLRGMLFKTENHTCVHGPIQDSTFLYGELGETIRDEVIGSLPYSKHDVQQTLFEAMLLDGLKTDLSKALKNYRK